LKLLLDEQQPGRAAELLRREGHDVISATEYTRLRGRPDAEILQTALGERRAVVTENVRDFAVLHRHWIDEGRSHYGIVLTSRRRFLRRKGAVRPLVDALRALLRAHPSDDALRDQLIWLE